MSASPFLRARLAALYLLSLAAVLSALLAWRPSWIEGPVRRGIPAICYGPRAERIHGIDERVSLRSMAEVARVLARFVLDWCGESNDGGESDGRS